MRFSALDGLTIGVWGAGLETRSFARHVAERLPRARVAVVVLEEPADAPELTDGALVVDAAGAPDALRSCDVVVRSPGVSIYRPELRGLRTTTPTALWMAEREGRDVIGVTATKGKSTTSKLIAHLVAAAGVPVELGGNIGAPALDLLDSEALAVIELSSYQIADLATGPETAVVSNVYAEHVNWHGSVEAYRADKLRLLTLPGVRRCVLNATAPLVMAAPRVADADVLTFGAEPGWHVREDGAVARGHQAIAALPLIGRHNALNVCGALTALEAVGVSLEDPAAALADFVGLDHRLQIVHEAGGVRWVDDSISTEPEAAKFAIESFPDADIVLIGGGFDRAQDYAALGVTLAARGARVLALPDTGARLVDAAWAAGVPHDRATLVSDLEAAVAAARAVARPGTVVLLSPAAPSFNTHKNFAVRGDHFAELARAS
ncbi:UDP-N-acetylmuramoyl-L-alanine--D-glutamate ligase [Solirubrobacter phytolaccae]|uniref:UDP-N-acetylmuramoylalanine--D-glutamate ligase n=1 Tax=Solirubrobacter phytolaccae TaxID=1404360 RepID=A0A9X3N5S5_9ACTN|nr:UDP-N-acetylmuramoyl-L-alanine--D-glutamate ligase [Solirubrobacter phytolaccae]MDA0179971.1 UDP-N-acetylmuramoyl-L-alanine--D-glutamate ligase [Solirubrobacter phytolaccae]